MNILKQSTAATIKLGPFVDDTDGKTAETALTISQADIRLSKNGGDFAQTNNATGATHDEFGYYDIPLDTTDTGTLGRLRVAVRESGALPVWQDFLVVTANVYDTLCSTDSLDVNVTALADDVITAGKFDESTAFPLKSADTGSTQVARVGADSDTLETLSDEIAAVKAETAAILADTGTDGVVLKAAGLAADAITALAVGVWTDMDIYGADEKGFWLQTLYDDLVNGGRLDLLIDSIIAHLVDIKGAGWTDETLKVIRDALTAAQADLDNPDQYKADVSALATTAHVQEVEDKVDTADAVADAIKAKTDQLTFTVANKVDATANTSSIAGDVWSYTKRTLTHPSVSAEEPEDSNTLILYRDADIAIELTDLTIPAGAKKYIFTIKDNLDSGDDQAVLQASYAIDGSEVETNTLVYINSAAAPVLTDPVTFTLTDTNITIDLTAEAAALLPRYERGYLNWDLKLVTDAAVTIVLQGLAQIIGTSTRAIE